VLFSVGFYFVMQALIVVFAIQILLLASAAWFDVASRLIPNRICLVLALVGMLGRLSVGPSALAISLGIAACVLLVLMMLHQIGALGGGDVKLLVAMALGLPPMGVMILFVVTALAGGVLCLVHLAMRRLPLPRQSKSDAFVLLRVYAVERWRIIRHGPIPYGVAIAFGGIWSLLKTMGA
jgi:prepilin peptidase CpaA